MLAWEGRVRRPHRLQIYPRPELLQSLVAPLDTQLATGDLVARVRADGLEFADTRGFVPGDRLRSVNWRASARRGELIVNERHPDRNADVVLFLDSFAEARRRRRGTTARSSAPCGRRRRSPAATSRAATGSGSSRSAASSAGSSRAAASSSATG